MSGSHPGQLLGWRMRWVRLRRARVRGAHRQAASALVDRSATQAQLQRALDAAAALEARCVELGVLPQD